MRRKKASNLDSKTFLLEIGTEELPLDAMKSMDEELPRLLKEGLEKSRLSYQETKVEITPRRLVILISGLPSEQAAETVQWVGPSYEKAYDERGQATEALLGFLRSKGLTKKEVAVKELSRGKYVVCEKSTRGRSLFEVLPETLKESLGRLSFPKTMIWEPLRFRFPRPIRWVLALVNDRVLPITIGGLKAGRLTWGHRFLAPRAIRIQRADWRLFTAALKREHVILEMEKRMDAIRKGVARQGKAVSVDEDLVKTTAQLVEEPFLLRGDMERGFLKLPHEILVTCMKKNQKIFPVYDSRRQLRSEFIAVINGRRRDVRAIASGYRHVLEVRLRDAMFFYQEDLKDKLESKVELLKEVIFLGKLGTVYEKIKRLEISAEKIASVLKLSSGELGDLKRAARLCKADLLTRMVYEFPELQGTMGREYAKAGGEKDEVARALADHYLPRTLGESYHELQKEQSRLGAILSIVDRMDTLVGACGVGLEPTGSEDPYALRRACGGIVKIIRAFGFRLDLIPLVDQMYSAYGNKMSAKLDIVKRGLESFFKERILFELGLRAGTREEEIARAVLKSGWSDIASVFLRFERLRKLFHEHRGLFRKTYKVVERTHNILKGVKERVGDVVREDLLKDPLERKLLELTREKGEDLGRLVEEEKFDEATKLYGETFHEVVHEFFDKVLVNVEDPVLRGNRQALMRQINRLYVDKIADLSLVTHLD